MDKKLIEKKMKIYTGILAVFFVILAVRLGYMQIIQADRYKTLATQNHQRLISVEAPRGEIIDRNGVRIVSNKPVYTVSLVYLGLKDRDVVIKRLSVLLSAESAFQGMSVQQIEQDIQDKIKGHEVMYEPVRVAVDVSQETVNKIEENRLDLPGVNIDIEPVRSYPFGDLLGEVLGYVREITGDQLEAHKDDGYSMGDSFGQVGLENTYENYLRGVNGARQVEVDAQGHPVRDLGLKEPIPGNNLVLTIDERLQRVAQDAIVEEINQARRQGVAKVPPNKPIAGAAVVTNVNTGEILAMASVPSYDLNIFSGPLPAQKYNDLLSQRALRNHAIQSIFTPGSTFKMVTASALLESKIVNVNTTIVDPGYYKYKKDWKPGGHGLVNILRAIQVSCDTFFYMFGAQAGPDLMDKYAAEYGLGQLTGVDLPGEEAGRVASKDLKKKMWPNNDWESQWHEYDSMDMAIGQQETRVTAMQLADYVEAIANGGTIYKPHLVKKVVSPDGSDLKTFQPEVLKKVNVSKETLDIIRQGMHAATTGEGTGAGVFWDVPYTGGSKTGTAEVGDAAQNAHALIVAFTPYEKPEIAISVIIEDGGHGASFAGPVARKIMDAYYQFKKDDAEGKPIQALQQEQTAQPAEPGQPEQVLPAQPAQTGQQASSGQQGQAGTQPGVPAQSGIQPQGGPSTPGGGPDTGSSPGTPPTGTGGGNNEAGQPSGGIMPPAGGGGASGGTGGNNGNTGRQPGGGQGGTVPETGGNGDQTKVNGGAGTN